MANKEKDSITQKCEVEYQKNYAATRQNFMLSIVGTNFKQFKTVLWYGTESRKYATSRKVH